MSDEFIFISYARDDGEDFATDLRLKLEDEFGEQAIWQDRDRMRGGENWWHLITEALDNVRFMVLVATPSAMASQNVWDEWRYARKQGVWIYPIKVPDHPIDWNSLPNWMRDVHFYDLDKEWQTFLNDLQKTDRPARVPFFGVPDLPEHFVERPDEFNALVSQLLDNDRTQPVAITTSLTGAGGFGKTTLASAICHDDNIKTAFDDGVLWVTLGENPNVVRELTKMYNALTDQNRNFVDQHEASSNLIEKLADRDVLIVIDDVWNPAHLRPFLKGGKRCARLITTRNLNIAVDANAKTNAVDEMTTAQSVEVLLGSIDLPDDLNPYEKIAERLGEWAIMLEIANGMLKQRIALGSSLQSAYMWLEKSLDKRGVMGIKRHDEDQRKRSAVDVLSASFEMLNDNECQRLYELAVFRDDANIPLNSIRTCWQIDEFDTEQLLEKFALYSFIRFDAEQLTVRIHDVVREVLEVKLNEKMPIQQAHIQLVLAYGLEESDWNNWDDYIWQNIGYHINAGSINMELQNLLINTSNPTPNKSSV